MLEEDYKNQEVMKIIKTFFKDNEIEVSHCELYELLEGYLL